MFRKTASVLFVLSFLASGPGTACTTGDVEQATAEIQRRIAEAENLTAEGQAALSSLAYSWQGNPADAYQQLQERLFATPELTAAQKDRLQTIFDNVAAGQIDYDQACDKATEIANNAGDLSEYVQLLNDFILLVIANGGAG